MPTVPQLLLVILITGVVFVNGWTDAPNSVTGVVSTGVMGYRSAVCLAAVFNLLGLLAVSIANASVVDTMLSIADFSNTGPNLAIPALCASMLAIILFAVGAWIFGIPTSESHALIAGLAGGALAVGSGQINGESWAKVLLGLSASVIFGFLMGFILSKISSNSPIAVSDKMMDRVQILGASAVAFMHGAQDGQKFVAVFVVSEFLAEGVYANSPINIGRHIPTLVFCAFVMAFGTVVGGHRIVNTVGIRMGDLEKSTSVCADIGTALCLMIASLSGIPMSTTHTKTTAIMGACAAHDVRRVNRKIVKGMFVAWIITFPVCGLLGYGFCRLFLRLFI